jgi:hypothetical protein
VPPAKLMIVRHAEKPVDGEPVGVRANGHADPESLTPRGWQRAGALARLFVPRDGRFADPALATPTLILATRAEEGAGASRRPKQTVRPLADLLGLELDHRFGKGEEAAAVASLLRHDGVVLVSWIHERVPAIVAALPGAPAVPRDWPEDRYDVVWVFEPAPDGGWTLTQVPQRLLAGDRDGGIPF